MSWRTSSNLERVETRFWSHVRKTETCWLWTGALAARGRYGSFRVGGQMVSAHRWIYERKNGPLASGLSVCHSCDTPACVRPEHLWAGTHTENMRDMIAKGRARWEPKRGKEHPLGKLTHCRNGGHPFSGSNLHVSPRGERICKTCRRENQRTRRARHAA